MDFLQTLGEKLSSVLYPSSVLEDVVSSSSTVSSAKGGTNLIPSGRTQDSVVVQKSAPKEKALVEPAVMSEHKCTCGGH